MWFKKPSILVIDDDTSIGILTKSRLMRENQYDVIMTDNGLDGINMISNKNPDLIILDWIMPGMNGLEVLNEIKGNPNTTHIPVLMLTGKNLVGEIEDAFNAGADGYLTKPLDLAKLSKKVNEILN